jgi:anti-sigma factor RsiW
MPDHETLDPKVHAVAMLLPLYLNGTLRDDERRQVTQHLAGCEACRTELEELTVMRASMKELYTSESGPSSRVFTTVMAKITAAPTRPAPKISTNGRAGILEHMEGWLRNLFLPKWAPALAVALIVGQSGLLLWTVQLRDSSDGISARSVSPEAGVRFRIAFQPSAEERQIRSLLQQLQARFISGPLPNGVYFIEVAGGDTAAIQQDVDAIRGQRDVVRMIEPVKP